MDKREAIRAMLNGKKVRVKTWPSASYIYFIQSYGKFSSNLGEYMDLNQLFETSDWEIYEEPKAKVKRKFYRRKWGYDAGVKTLGTELQWFASIDQFDEYYSWFIAVSSEVEEMEVEMDASGLDGGK